MNDDKELEEILNAHAQEFKAGHLDKVKTAILDWHKKQELQARISERNKIALDNYRGKTFSESTNWQAMYEQFMEGNELAIKDMEREMKGER